MAWCGTGAAAEKRFGAWTVGAIAGDEGVYSATRNDSGGVLGQYCLREGGRCLWLLANDVGCEDGARYPVLVNASDGAASAELVCMKLDGKPRYAFADFDLIDRVAKESDWIGVAFPMESGLFKVSRFSLSGAERAVALMRRAAEAMVERATEGTVDRSL
jgi:hypothetical protein